MNIHPLITKLKTDAGYHEAVEPPLTPAQVDEFQQRSGFRVPPSFRIFLQEFGGGAYWLYGAQPIDATKSPCWFQQYYVEAPDSIPVDGTGAVPKGSLFCLMAEDSNGGTWCWLKSLPNAAGEYPLAYYSGEAFHCRAETFADWLKILVESEGEVIRALDEDGVLGLG